MEKKTSSSFSPTPGFGPASPLPHFPRPACYLASAAHCSAARSPWPSWRTGLLSSALLLRSAYAAPHALFPSLSLRCRPHPSAAPSFFPALLPFSAPPLALPCSASRRARAYLEGAKISPECPAPFLPRRSLSPPIRPEPSPPLCPFLRSSELQSPSPR